jgi:hypothetical protein
VTETAGDVSAETFETATVSDERLPLAA